MVPRPEVREKVQFDPSINDIDVPGDRFELVLRHLHPLLHRLIIVLWPDRIKIMGNSLVIIGFYRGLAKFVGAGVDDC